MRLTPTTAVLTLVLTCSAFAAGPPSVVAAENFYGDVAAQIAGPGAAVASILSNPDQDPHLFSANPSTARAIADAGIIVYNGVDYDPWMAKLVQAARGSRRQVIVAGQLVHRAAGVNPHLWYDPAVMPVVARAIAAALGSADAPNAAAYQGRLTVFLDSLKPLHEKIAAMRGKYAGQTVTATEPVFGYMATALGLKVRNERFQLSVMNSTEPRASDVAAFESDLRGHKVRVLLYNSQATEPAAQRLVKLAQENDIPVVGVTETEPPGVTFQAWMLDQLNALDAALGKTPG